MQQFTIDIGFTTNLGGCPAKDFTTLTLWAIDDDEAAVAAVRKVEPFATEITHIEVKRP